jgi:hypothetical protein
MTAFMLLNVTPAQADEGPCAAGSRFCAGGRAENQAVLIGAAEGPPADSSVDWGENAAQNPTRCTFSAPPESFDQEIHPVVQDGIPRRARWYVRNCGGSDEYRWYQPGTSEGADPVVQLLIERAIERVSPPAPGVVTSPPVGSQVLTGMPMYLAVGEGAFSEQSGSVSAGQFTVTATVTPVETVFVPGDDGEARTCPGSGTVWSRGDRPDEAACTHTYTHTPAHLHGDGDRFTLRARVSYEASYTVEGPVLAGTYDLGSFEGPESVVEVPVVERRAVRTSGS